MARIDELEGLVLVVVDAAVVVVVTTVVVAGHVYTSRGHPFGKPAYNLNLFSKIIFN